jgi:hypothetical protein
MFPRMFAFAYALLFVACFQIPIAQAQLNEREIVDLRQRLSRPVSVHFHEAPLAAVHQWIAQQAGMSCVVDVRALDDLGIDATDRLSLVADHIPLQTAIELLLEPFDMTWAAKPGVLVITTVEEYESDLVARVYPVADLLGSDSTRYDFDTLIDMIIANVQVNTWAENGGSNAEIRSLPNPRALVVSQTIQAHFEIEDLLTRLREVRQQQGVPTLGGYSPPAVAKRPVVHSKRYINPGASVPVRLYESGE